MIDVPETGDALLDRLAYGTGRLYKGNLANVEATVRRAYDLGIRHFDSSIQYDAGAAHAALGRLVRNRDIDLDTLFVSTKIGYMNETFPGALSLYHNADVLWGLVHECYRVLHGKIDLLQIHEADLAYWWSSSEHPGSPIDPNSVASGELSLEGAPVLEVMQRVRSEGVAKHVGVTGNSAAPLAAVLRSVSGIIRADSVMCAYNLDPVFRGTLEHIVPAARDSAVTVMAAGVLQGGSYRAPYDLPRTMTTDPRVKPRFAEFDTIQKESGLSAVELLMRWMLSVPGIDRWILGSSGPDQLEQSMVYLRRGLLPSDLQEALDGLAVPGLNRRTRD